LWIGNSKTVRDIVIKISQPRARVESSDEFENKNKISKINVTGDEDVKLNFEIVCVLTQK